MAEADEEQIEAIKRWWDENGKSMLIGIALALAGVFGYQAWDKRVQETGEAASALYEDLLVAVAQDDPFATLDDEQISTARFIARQLKDEYSDTTYAHFAALFMAKLAVEQENFETAESELNWALENGIDESLAMITRTRLAQVLLAQEKYDEALASLSEVDSGEHRPAVEELTGDIYMAMGDTGKARESYQLAVNSLSEDESRPMLQMKLDDLIAPKAIVPAGESIAAESDDGE